jgi:hypothetical protein
MKAVYSGTIESLKIEIRQLSDKLDTILEQRELLHKALSAIVEANKLAAANNGSRPNQLGQHNIFVIFKATGILDLLYKNLGDNAAETGRMLELITGYAADEFSRMLGREEFTPTKLDVSSADNALEQLAKHLEANKSPKVARAVRLLGQSTE